MVKNADLCPRAPIAQRQSTLLLYRMRYILSIAKFDRFRHTVYGIIFLEVKEMTTKNIYERVAELNHTTPEEVEKEIRQALELAQVPMDPEVFIEAAANHIRESRRF